MNVVDVRKRINELAEERGLSPYDKVFSNPLMKWDNCGIIIP